ncbi:MAG: hypothetical protein H6Q10_3735 [Acidobacteria bacterium]|nr:hypothetical protein [Acidobacteriota bacterium]
MDPSFRTPLLDCFRRGEAPRDVRLLAAAGRLAPRAHEQLALLVLLSEDQDEEIRQVTEGTIRRLPPAPLAAFLARSDVHPDIRAFFAARGLAPDDAEPGGDTSTPLVQEEGGAEPVEPAEPPAPETRAEVRPAEAEAPPEEDQRPAGATQRLALMNVGQKMKVAMLGTREERNILIRDSNRLVAAAVLSSPKLSESEVESIAKMANVSDEVLRIVGTSRAWTKNYNVIASLARNPKTPIAISLSLMSRLTSRDVKMLSVDRNVPEPLRVAARKQALVGESRRQ